MQSIPNMANVQNMNEVLGPQTVSLFDMANGIALGFGMTLIGVLLICYVFAIIAKPFFYLFFVVKLGYQGIKEMFFLIKGFFMSIFSFFRFIWSESRDYLAEHPEIREWCIEKKEAFMDYIRKLVADVKARFKTESDVL